jgi:hypothetical protein
MSQKKPVQSYFTVLGMPCQKLSGWLIKTPTEKAMKFCRSFSWLQKEIKLVKENLFKCGD